MSVYLLASFDIDDPKAYEAYPPATVPVLMKHGGELVVVDTDVRPLEGEKRTEYVVVKFPSEEAAMAWYNDPDYAEAKALRMRVCSNGNMVIAKQFVMPSG
ncbi:MAG TPA: DUF1330 domain-containing protein [Fimbriimonadaceae bacterium]|nr:DUF1330 domain-containing protein [Fimbriimonadaceae bacterium]